VPRIRKRLGHDAENADPTTADEERQDVHSHENSSTTAVEGQKRAGQRQRHVPSKAHRWMNDYFYVVVGLMGEEVAPNETLRRVRQMDGLFKEIRRAHRELRGPIRRMMSLKELSGFSVSGFDSGKTDLLQSPSSPRCRYRC
jgi:hypothetical protein